MTLFELLNAPAHASAVSVWIALLCAQWLVFAVPLVLAGLWLWGNLTRKQAAVGALAAGLLALGLAQVCGLHYVPRPFAAGVGHTLMSHAPDSSFPSDHATVMAAVAVSLLLLPDTRRWGALLGGLWLPMGWARVYVGVHYPSDIVGGALAGALVALLVWRFGSALVKAGTSQLTTVYAVTFRSLISRGWVT